MTRTGRLVERNDTGATHGWPLAAGTLATGTAASRVDASGTTVGVGDFASRHLPVLDEQFAGVLASASRLGETYRGALARALGLEGASGRRWRPLLVLVAADAMGRRPAELAGLAAAVELTHTASLVLDDMPCMDDSELRRGEPATHARVGADGAILLAVSCLAAAAEQLGRTSGRAGEICAAWGSVVGLDGMAGGQAMDLYAAGVGRLSGEARRLHRRKSTALPAFALLAAALAVGADRRLRETLHATGRDLGWAYQLADDAHDRSEDGRRGLAPGGTRPERQSRRLLDRACRRIEDASGLSDEGRRLLTELAEAVVAGRDPRGEGAR